MRLTALDTFTGIFTQRHPGIKRQKNNFHIMKQRLIVIFRHLLLNLR